ncbi:MAG: hypothetical protein ACWGO1_14315 [Anaerolineales bacterium]
MSDMTRRVLGLIFGLLFGLTFGLVANLINSLYLPGIPLYSPDPGRNAIILLTCLSGGLIGLVTAWSDEAITGVLAGALVGALATTIFNLSNRSAGFEFISGLFVLLVMTFLPRAVLFLPVAGLVRWVLGIWGEEFQTVSFSIRRLALSFLSILLLAGVVGIFSLYPRYAREVLVQMDQIVQSGLQVSDPENLSQPLKGVDGFLQRATENYTLQLSDNPDLLPIQRPMTAYDEQEYAVYVRFDNGFRFGCVFTPNAPNPGCIAY